MARKHKKPISCSNPLSCKVPAYYHKIKGTLPDDLPQYLGPKKTTSDTTITVYRYSPHSFERQQLKHSSELSSWIPSNSDQLWINVCGLNAPHIIQEIGNFFSIHPVVVEDLSNTFQRSKLESYDRYIFYTCRVLSLDENKQISNHPLFFILMDHVLLSFHELPYPRFENIIRRLQQPDSRMRSSKVDYLAYALLDDIVDEYFSITEWYSEELEKMDDQMLNNAPRTMLENISLMKNKLISLKRTLWPMRQLIHSLNIEELSMIHASTKLYLRDVYDHTIQIVESLETFRELLSSMMDVYLSQLNNRTNEVMKVLTMIATVFMPLSFITGIYGMNFIHMPELQWKHAYPIVMFLFFALMGSMLIYFKKKKWF